MSLLNLFFKTQEEKKILENTVNLKYKTARKKIEDFIKLVKPITVKRRNVFDNLFGFVLDGDQWTNSEVKDLDGDMDLSFNFSEDYIDRYMARLFPRNPLTGVMEVGVKVYEKNSELKEKYEGIILDVYKAQSLVPVLLEQGVNYLCGGAGILYYPQDPITKKMKLISLNPRDCYLGWSGNKIVQFAYREYVGDNKYNIYYWDLNEFLSWDGLTNEITRFKNKFDFIPVSWVANNPKPHKHEGRSKILSLFNLDRAYNFAATDFAVRVKDNTKPHLAVFSDTVALGDVDRGRKKKTKLSQDDDMKYLELPESQEILNYLTMLENRIKSKAGIIDSSGSIQSGVSGVSLSYQYSDMMDLIGFMRVSWDSAFRALNNTILAYSFGEKDYKTDPLYHPPLSIDNTERIKEYEIMLNNKLISHRDAIDELRGVENPDLKLDEILKEDEKINPAWKQNNNNNNKNNFNN